MQVENLLHEIKDAFQNVEYPGDHNIVTSPEYPESYEMMQDLRGKRWDRVEIEHIVTYRMSLVRFTPEGFRYYLPAFLTAAVADVEPGDIDIFLFLSLMPKDDQDYQTLFPKLQLLDDKQKAAIRKFLQMFLMVNPSYHSLCGEKSKQFWQIRT